MHVLSISQFNPDKLQELFNRTEEIRTEYNRPTGRKKLAGKYSGKQLCSLFYEPSTRTRISFEAAALKLGMGVVSTENAREFSSAAKGETLEDTIRVLNQYKFDVIVIRHHEAGTADRAAELSTTPIINAGDGSGEHPTQALLDAYTVYRQFKRLDNLKIVIGGDLKYGRTARSFALLMSMYPGNEITFVSLPDLGISDDIKQTLAKNKTSFNETTDMKSAFASADVVYWTRLQKERIKDQGKILSGGFKINKQTLKLLPSSAIILHPLPRVDEIDPQIDNDKRSKYFEQAGNGLYIRMALLDNILSNNNE